MVRVVPNSENNLLKDSAADAFQICAVAEERLLRRLGQVGPEVMRQVQAALTTVLNIEVK